MPFVASARSPGMLVSMCALKVEVKEGRVTAPEPLAIIFARAACACSRKRASAVALESSSGSGWLTSIGKESGGQPGPSAGNPPYYLLLVTRASTRTR